MRRLAAGVAAVWIAAGCGVLTGERFATNDELRGAWRAEPLSVDPATIAAGDRVCKESGGMIGGVGKEPAVAVDARGGGHLSLIFEAANGGHWACQLRMDATGDLAKSGGHVRAVGGPAIVARPNEVMILDEGAPTGLNIGQSLVYGRAGSAVSTVRVVFAGGSSLRASVGGGWFSAWWPTDETNFVVEAFDSIGAKVGEARP